MRALTLIRLAALGVALAGCGGASYNPAGQGGTVTDRLDCRGTAVSVSAMQSAPLASGLPASARKAFLALTGIKNVAVYRVLEDKDGSLTIGDSLSERDAAALGPGSGSVNFRMATIDSSPSGGESAHGWWYVSDTTCELQREFEGLAAADAWLDPAFPAPRPGDTAIHLLVSERDCAGGKPAGDRIKVAELLRDGAQVRIALGIKPQSGDTTCPGTPSEPFTVDLEIPLGDQQVLNSAAYPARAFAQPGGSAPFYLS